MAKYKTSKYKSSYFCGGINGKFSLITCEYKMNIPLTLQIYILNWYYMYLFHPEMYRTKEMIHKHLYWTVIIKSAQKEVISCDTCQRTKRSNRVLLN